MEESSQVTSTPPTTENPNDTPEVNVKTRKMFVFGFLGVLLGVVVLIAGIAAFRVYRQTATDRFTVSVATALHFPALSVNGRGVSYTEYVEDWKAINVMRNYDRGTNGPAAQMNDKDLSDQVVMRYVNNTLLEEEAAKQNVTVEQSDIDAVKNQIMAQFKTVDVVNAELQKRYGWDFDTYVAKVMRPYILQNKLSTKVQQDPAARETVRQRAQVVLDKVLKGDDFATLATQFGEDGTRSQGGELGWFGKGEMVPQFETAVFALKKNEVTKTLVESPFGYHIIKLEDRKFEKVKDATTGKTTNQEKVQARHILFSFPSLQTLMSDALMKAQVRLYINVHNPVPELLAAQTAAKEQQPPAPAPAQ